MLSDPVWEIESASWFSFFASAVEILGAIGVGVAGVAVIREQGLGSFGTARPSAGA